jgi:hypothetical protein
MMSFFPGKNLAALKELHLQFRQEFSWADPGSQAKPTRIAHSRPRKVVKYS